MNRVATLFSIITTIGLVSAIVAAICWGLLAATHHEHTGARRALIIAAVVAVVGFLAFLKAYDPTLSRRQAQAPAEKPVSAVEDAAQADTPAEPLAAVVAQEEAVEGNPFLALTVETRPVMNGPGTERIGTWAFVEITKADMENVTGQQLHDFLESVSAEKYNWFNVFFEDGTGLYAFMPSFVEYGAVGRDAGGAVEPTGDAGENVYLFTDGRYTNES